jgi:hypothetical protein
MQYDLLIERTLKEAQGILRANLPPAKNLPDDEAVQSLRAIVRTPHVRGALERGNDTALCFVLRAVNRILSDDDQPDRTTISRLWDVLDKLESTRAHHFQRNMKKPPAR